MSTSVITSKGQITIPKKIREELGLSKGDELQFEITTGPGISIIPVKKSTNSAYGVLYRENQEAMSVEEMDQGVSDYFKKKYRTK